MVEQNDEIPKQITEDEKSGGLRKSVFDFITG